VEQGEKDNRRFFDAARAHYVCNVFPMAPGEFMEPPFDLEMGLDGASSAS
jgi:hypothetical protein